MKQQQCKASHYQGMFLGYDRCRNLGEVLVHRQDQHHMEVLSLEISLVALAELPLSMPEFSQPD